MCPSEPSAFAFVTAFISGVIVSLTLRLYKLSRNYRYVTRVLSKEKKALKQEKDFGQGHRIGAGRIWAPIPTLLRTHGYDFTIFFVLFFNHIYRLIEKKSKHTHKSIYLYRLHIFASHCNFFHSTKPSSFHFK